MKIKTEYWLILGAALGVVYLGYRSKEVVTKVVTEDLNPNSNQNFVYRAASGEDGTVRILDPLFSIGESIAAVVGLGPKANKSKIEEKPDLDALLITDLRREGIEE
jgi:hypothetical protein